MAQIARADNIFNLVPRLIADNDISTAYKVCRDASKQLGLFDDSVRRDLARIRELGFVQHNWQQASFLLARTARRLAEKLE